MNSDLEPKLGLPGAGLPKVELRIGRLLFALRYWTGSRGSFTARFRREREAIQQLVSTCSAESAKQRVLIKRIAGLEDSSRYWSVWMTLDHLRIVNREMTKVIAALTNGVVPPGQAGTAGVKPSPAATASALGEFEASCDALLAAVAASPNLKTKLRYTHPWFGALNASEWHALAASHMGIHRGQIERILEGLPPSTKQRRDQELQASPAQS